MTYSKKETQRTEKYPVSRRKEETHSHEITLTVLVDFTENQQVIHDVLINPAEKKIGDLLLDRNDTGIIIKIIPYEQRRKELDAAETDFDLPTNMATFKLGVLLKNLFEDKKQPSEEEFVDKLKELAKSVAEYSLWNREKRIMARQSAF